MNMNRRVVVTGLGAVTPLGVGAHCSWRSLLAGRSGITSLINEDSNDNGIEGPRGPVSRWQGLPCTVAGLVPQRRRGHVNDDNGDAADTTAWSVSDWLDETEQRRMSLFTQYAIASAEMAFVDAGWRPDSDSDRQDTGVCLGSGIGNLDDMYETSIAFHEGGYKKVHPLFVPRLLTNMAAGHLSMRHSLYGPNHAVTTACTTGAHSIGDAFRFIAHGSASAMLAGGSEACIHPLTLAGFSRARSLATTTMTTTKTTHGDHIHNHNRHDHNDDVQDDDSLASRCCRPFDARRTGFVVAEGATVLLLEELEHARRRGARVYAEIRGYGCSGDGHHMTAPRTDGAGALLAMRRALADAGVRPARVDYLNAHATGTRIGDAAEARAIHTLMLGHEGRDRESDVVVSATKGATGHLLGAAGAVEAMFSIMAITENIVPPTLNLTRPDVGIDFNFVPLQAQQMEVDVAVSNSFGFGGTNCSLVFSKVR